MSTHRLSGEGFEDLAQFFSIIDAFENHLKQEYPVMSYGSIEEMCFFVDTKEHLSKEYQKHLNSLQRTGILKQLNQYEKDYIRVRLHSLKASLEDNINYLKSQEEQASLIIDRTRKKIIKRQKSAFYDDRGKASFISQYTTLSARV